MDTGTKTHATLPVIHVHLLIYKGDSKFPPNLVAIDESPNTHQEAGVNQEYHHRIPCGL